MMVVSEEKGGIFFPCFHGAQAATAMNRPMLTVTINGKAQQFAAGLTVLQALRQCGEDVATLCHDERMKPAATGCAWCTSRDTTSRSRPATRRSPTAW